MSKFVGKSNGSYHLQGQVSLKETYEKLGKIFKLVACKVLHKEPQAFRCRNGVEVRF
jgi:hypothetical protein